MNYRHAFHAGNFADLVKHAALLHCLRLAPGPLRVIDTHAGAGVYDLRGEAAGKSGEAQRGILRLAADPAAPAAFAPLLEAVRTLNPQGSLRYYPGSPALICGAMGKDGFLDACELHPADFRLLEAWMGRHCPRGQARQTDGFAFAAGQGTTPARLLVHIDPPYEQPGDYQRAIDAAVAVTAAGPASTVMIWLPLKDLETFDRFLRLLEARRPPPALIAEVRLRPLTNPMAMNGCVLVILNPPAGLEGPLQDICRWTAQTLGDEGCHSAVWRLSGD